MAEAFPTIGGDGANSYTKNSQSQKEGVDTVKGMIEEAIIENLDTEKLFSISTTVTIVDWGCSIGPNTFFAVQNLIESVQNKHSSSSSSSSSKTLEFRVFFNDHSTNDFNTLFASLPPERPYHAAGVPGSFHGRLFHSNSITIAYSFNALPWLSKQPELGFLNEGRIHYAGASQRVLRAYSDQFERDFESFLSARGEEIVSGGSCSSSCLSESTSLPLASCSDFLDSASWIWQVRELLRKVQLTPTTCLCIFRRRRR